jgi:CheY-like chemotaxis protein
MSTEAEFLQQVRDGLSHLYDYAYLESHPLTARFWPASEPHGPHRAQRLHRLLIESIEELHPPAAPVKGASRAEYYFLLVYRYIEEWPPADIMQKLGYSRRQFFRQQQKAVEMLAGLLSEKAPAPRPLPVEAENELDDELERFRTRHRAVDPREIVQGVLEMVGRLADHHGVTLVCDLPDRLPVIYGSRTLLRQVFLNSLSQLITQPRSQRIRLRLFQARQRVGAELTAEFAPGRPGPADQGQTLEPEPIRHLVEMMHGHWQAFELNETGCTYRFEFPAEAERWLLVVEDNEGVIQAFRRYLVGYDYQVISATTGAEAMRLAREMRPSVITLDVMMPGQDGWEILNGLKRDLATQPIPVIICSVLEDPELARSLGAAAYLRKPVGQTDLLTLLDRLSGSS